MIDAPGPWGTGPFTLTQGYSSIDADQAVTRADPFACIWLTTEDRTAEVQLTANSRYWDGRRGPRLESVVFRNDVPAQRALDLVCDTDGEVDLLTEVHPADAERVERSEHARLVAIDAFRVFAGVINRKAEGLPLHDRRARRALNLAIDRRKMVRTTLHGRARPMSGLTPPVRLTVLHRFPGRLRPYPHDAARAAATWRKAAGTSVRPVRIAALEGLGDIAQGVAVDLRRTLGVSTEVTVYTGDESTTARRALAKKACPSPWDVLIVQQGGQSADVPPLELHRAFVGEDGEYRAGPVLPTIEKLFTSLKRQTSQLRQVLASNRIDRYVRRHDLALFLVAPQALYAVNRHVTFTPYATTLELAETHVSRRHWSRRR